jgi:hypothetical protein
MILTLQLKGARKQIAILISNKMTEQKLEEIKVIIY